jgi:hypothetical protein
MHVKYLYSFVGDTFYIDVDSGFNLLSSIRILIGSLLQCVSFWG